MKNHRKNLMRRGLAAILSGMMLTTATMSAWAVEAPTPVEESKQSESEAPASVAPEETVVQQNSYVVSANGTPVEGAETAGGETGSPEAVEEGAKESPASVELLPVNEEEETTSHPLIEIKKEEEAGQAKELSKEPMTLTAHTYSGVNVTVEAEAGILPADTRLSVYEVKNEVRLEETDEILEEAGVEYDEQLTLDISLFNSDFEKIEPEGGVSVSISMDADKLPEDADLETLEIHHLAEDEQGEVTSVDTVADNGLETEGTVEINEEAGQMESNFTVEGFSKFVITWARTKTDVFNLNITTTDLQGNEITINWIEDGYVGVNKTLELKPDLNDGEEVTPESIFMFEDIARDHHIYNIEKYLFKRAMIPGDEKNVPYGISLEKLANGNTRAYYLDEYGERMNGLYVTRTNAKGLDINFQYELRDDNLTVVPSVDSTSLGIEMYMSLHDATGTPYAYSQTVDSSNRLQYKFADRMGSQLYYKQDITSGFSNGLISPRQYVQTFIDNYSVYKDKVLNKDNQKNATYWNNKGGFPWKLKLQRGMIWPSLTSRLIPEGEEFPRIDTVGRGTYMDYVNDFMDKKRFEGELNGSNSMSLKELFDPDGNGSLQYGGSTQQVNHLFREDIYEATGYFYYGSDRNHAQLEDQNTPETDFILYDEVATRINLENTADNSYIDTFYARRGNFLPYNHITDKVVLGETTTDMAGNQISALEAADPGSTVLMGDKLGEEAVYKVQERPVYGFGLSMQADFVQPENGRVKWKNNQDQPMIFEFNGDDDVWVYIDDVLVLDLGGSHAAQNAIINFETGNIYWTDNGSMNFGGYNVTSNQSAFNTRDHSVDDYYTVEGKNQSFAYDDKSTIRAMYERAIGVEGTRALNIWSDGNNGNTFRSGTKHTFKFYYLEHGGGASNLRLSFNIQPEPIGDLEVAKEFTEEGLTYEKMVNGVSEAVIPDDFRAVFSLYTARKNETTGLWEPDEFVDEAELTQETYEQGLFTKYEDPATGRVRFSHTFKRLALSNMYIVDEKIYKTGKGYLGDPEGTSIDLSGTKGTPQESAKDVNDAKYQLSTGTAANVTALDSTTKDLYTINWKARNAKIHLKAYYINEEGQEVPINDVEALTRGVEENFNGSVTNNKLNGRYPQDGDEINIEEFLSRRKLTKVGSYVFNHAEFGAALKPTSRMSALQVINNGSGLKIVDEQGRPGGANGTNQYSNVSGKEYTIKVYYDKAFYEYRSDAFEIYGMGNRTNYPATAVVENKYLTPLSIRKVLRSSMEPDLERDFRFRLYVKNRDGSVYQPAQGLVGTVYQVIKTEDPQAPGGYREELVEKKVPDGNGGTKVDERFLLLKENAYYEFEIKRDEEITFALPKGLKYKVVEIIEQGYKVTGAINLKDTEGVNKELTLIDNEFTENQVRKKTWETEELTFTEETLVTVTNSFDIARTGVAMSVLPFVLMVLFGVAAVGALMVITIRRRALHMED